MNQISFDLRPADQQALQLFGLTRPPGRIAAFFTWEPLSPTRADHQLFVVLPGRQTLGGADVEGAGPPEDVSARFFDELDGSLGMRLLLLARRGLVEDESLRLRLSFRGTTPDVLPFYLPIRDSLARMPAKGWAALHLYLSLGVLAGQIKEVC